MANKKPSTGLIANRQARRDYAVIHTYEAGIVLSGAEVKSLRLGHGHLRGAYVVVKDDELWLNNATITPTNTNRNSFDEADQTRARKLLIKPKELKELASAKEQGLSIIPLMILNKKRFIKVEIATARGLKKYDKRERLKKRDTAIDIQRSLTR
jgi:SsrA-binding protein